MLDTDLKRQVRAYWNKESCGTDVASSDIFTRQYFDEIEEHRYAVEPEIFSFAQFTCYYGRKILEVGFGAGTDFLQWVRAGAKDYGVDLTEDAVEHVRKRLQAYGLSAEEIRVADAENLPYTDNTFDLVYSWGVIHHSPDTVTIKHIGAPLREKNRGAGEEKSLHADSFPHSFGFVRTQNHRFLPDF